MPRPEMIEASPRPSADDRLRRPASLHENPNVFDDEYAVPDSASFSSGSRRSHDNDSLESSPLPADDLEIESPSEEATSSHPSATPCEQSVAPSTGRNSKIAITRDKAVPRKPLASALNSPVSENPLPTASASVTSDDTVVPNRSISNASSFTFARSQSPFQGASGPSHPYAMYPQNLGLGRPSSIATTSTIRPSSLHINSTASPSHPYALYSQNVFADVDGGAEAFAHTIPVGFTGQLQTFHRQIGPEGEELDIIGPDGHTEQLPPYTKYDTYALRSSPSLRMPAIGEHPMQEMQQSDEAMVSPLTLSTPRDYLESGDSTRLASSTDETNVSEKQSWRRKVWARRRSTVCGCMPMWVLWLIIGFFAVLLIVLAGCVGYYRSTGFWPYHSGHDDGSYSPTVTVTTTKLIGAIPTMTPPAMPPLPTGVYAAPFAPEAIEQSSGCLPSNQTSAWSCDFTGPKLDMKVWWLTGNSNSAGQAQAEASIGVWEPFQHFGIGALPPNIQNQTLTMVTDPDDPASGPALYFETTYDKVVIIPEASLQLPPSPSGSKRAQLDIEEEVSQFQSLSRRDLVIGQHYWYCIWKETFIAGFIYVNPPSSGSQSISGSYPVTAQTASAPSNTVPGYMSTTPSATPMGSSPVSSPYPRKVKLQERRIPDSPGSVCELKQVLNDWTFGDYPQGNPVSIMLQENDPPLPTPTAKRRRWVADFDDSQYACQCEWE